MALRIRLGCIIAAFVFASVSRGQTNNAPSDSNARRARLSLPPLVDFQVPFPPTPVKADGKQLLVYELHITNFSTNKLELTCVEVLKDRSIEHLASFMDDELEKQMTHVGFMDKAVIELLGLTLPPDQPRERTINPGLRAVMFLMLTLEKEINLPKTLRHRLHFKPTLPSAKQADEVVEGAEINVIRKRPLVLGPPVRGGGWLAAGALSNTSYHRRSVFPLNGRARISQRFAIDWARLGPGGRIYRGDDFANTNAFAYGEEVLAVADAVVAQVKDGVPENDPTSNAESVSFTLDTALGNHVTLDLGKGRFAFYSHLQPNSLRVRLGQKVRRGQVLARLGNSGHSHGPHLHFHVADANSVDAEGIPFVFESFELQGVLSSLHETWQPSTTNKPEIRRREIPTENAIVRFP